MLRNGTADHLASQVRLSQRLVLLTILSSLLCVAPSALSAPRRAGGVLPERTETVPACCPSYPESGEPVAHLVVLDEVINRGPLSEDVMRSIKARVSIDPDLPRGRLASKEEETADGVGAAESRARSAKARVRKSFDGLNIVTAAHQGSQFFPADTNVAASPTKVLEVSNVGLRLTNRQGNQPRIRSLNNFFGVLYPPVVFDPKVFFDRLSSRFFVVALSKTDSPRTSSIHLAVSKSSSPASLDAPDHWCNYRINAKRKKSAADYPGLGVNERWLAISVNNFSFRSRFKSVFIYAVSKPDLVDNGSQCPALTLHRFKAKRDDRRYLAFTVQPAQHYSSSAVEGAPLYFLSTAYGRADNYVLWTLQDHGGAEPSLSKVTIDSGDTYDFPPDAPQKNGTILDTGDQRVMQTAFRDGLLWAVHATGCTVEEPPNESCIRAISIAPQSEGGTVMFQDTFGRADEFMWWPGIAVNRQGDALVAAQRSGEERFLGTAYSVREARAESFGPVKALKKGSCPLDNWSEELEKNRTGDFVGVQADPKDDVGFWIAGEYTGAIPGQGCDWRTRIGRVK